MKQALPNRRLVPMTVCHFSVRCSRSKNNVNRRAVSMPTKSASFFALFKLALLTRQCKLSM